MAILSLFVYVWLCACVSVLANRYNRNKSGYFFASILFTPILCGLMLIAEGERVD